MNKFLKLILFSTFSLLCTSCLDKFVYRNGDDTISVVCKTDDHCTVSDDSIKKVHKGESCTFSISFDEGYRFFKTTEGDFDISNSLLTINNIQKPTTVSIYSNLVGVFCVNVVNDNNKGDVKISPNYKTYALGDEISISTIAKNGNKFISYSYNAASHGTTTSSYEKIGVPFSYDSTSKIVITNDLNIYVNYYKDEYFLITYHGNGGSTVNGTNLLVTDFRLPNYQYQPNSIQGTRYFTREGYILTSWNTKQDGSGTRIGLGSKIPFDCCDNNTCELYASWTKETDLSCFEYETMDDNSIAITNYHEETNFSSYLAIPREINNLTVKTIKENSIKTIKESIILPDTISTIETNAIKSNECTNFLFFTSVENIQNDSIECPNINKMYINSTVFTVNHEPNIRDLSRKISYIEYLKNCHPYKNRFFMIGHSTLFQNHDVSSIAAANSSYDIYKLCTVYGFDTDALLEICKSIVEPSDKIMYQFHEGASSHMDWASYDFLAWIDCDFDLYLRLEFSKFLKYFWQDYAQWRSLYTQDFNTPIFGYETYIEMDSYGNVIQMSASDYDVDDSNKGSSTISILESRCKPGFYSNILNSFKKLSSQDICIVWTTYNKNSIEDYSSLDLFESSIRDDFSDYEFVESIRDNCMEGKYFRYNDNSHLTVDGGLVRVNRWLEFINNFLD